MVDFPRLKALALATCAVAALAGCEDRHRQPIAHTPHGAAVRANMAAHIIDPRPPARRGAATDANWAVRAVTAYQKGEIKQPTETGTTPDTGALD